MRTRISRILTSAAAVVVVYLISVAQAVPPFAPHSLEFNGIPLGSIVRVPYSESQNSFITTHGFTAELWVKLLDSASHGALMNKAVGDCKDDWVLAVNPGRFVELRVAHSCTGNNQSVEMHEPLSTHVWHHVAGVWDRDSITLFVDGRLVASCFSETPPTAHAIDLAIGANNHWNGGHIGIYGRISEVRYSNTVRYRSDFTPALRFESDAATIFLYHFSEGSGDTLHDASPHGIPAFALHTQWSNDVPGMDDSLANASRVRDLSGNNSGIDPWMLPSSIVLGALAISGLGVRSWRRRRTVASSAPAPSVQPSAQRSTGPGDVRVGLIGPRLKVVAGQGDMAAHIAPKQKELLLYLLLHSIDHEGRPRGSSPSDISAALWSDASRTASKNLRSVTFARLRDTLEPLGMVRLELDRRRWFVGPERLDCDYFLLMRLCPSLLVSEPAMESIASFIRLTSAGPLLHEEDYPWLDGPREDVNRLVTRTLTGLLKRQSNGQELETSLALAENLLRWDELNEYGLTCQLSALQALGRHGAAREALGRFGTAYERLHGSPYDGRLSAESKIVRS